MIEFINKYKWSIIVLSTTLNIYLLIVSIRQEILISIIIFSLFLFLTVSSTIIILIKSFKKH